MSEAPSLLRLTWTFLRIGAVAFGGLGATLALIEQELVEHQKVASREAVVEALTYTKLLPGSTVVQVVAYLGWRLGGWMGSALSTAAFLAPSVVLMLALAHGYSSVAGLPEIAAVRRGVLAAVVGLLLVAMYRLGQPVLTSPLAVGLGLAAFLLGGAVRANAVLVVLAAGLSGLLTERR